MTPIDKLLTGDPTVDGQLKLPDMPDKLHKMPWWREQVSDAYDILASAAWPPPPPPPPFDSNTPQEPSPRKWTLKRMPPWQLVDAVRLPPETVHLGLFSLAVCAACHVRATHDCLVCPHAAGRTLRGGPARASCPRCAAAYQEDLAMIGEIVVEQSASASAPDDVPSVLGLMQDQVERTQAGSYRVQEVRKGVGRGDGCGEEGSGEGGGMR